MMERQIKIVGVIHSLGIGGMEQVMSSLLNHFSEKKNVQVEVILIGRDREVAFPLNGSIKVHKPPFEFNNRYRSYHTFKTLKFLRKKVKKLAPDTVLGFGEMWNNLTLLALKGLSYPVYISDRSQPNKNLGKLHNYLRAKMYPTASGFIAQTSYAGQNAARNNWNPNIQVIGNPVKMVEPTPPAERENIVLSVGRLISTKHFDDLIQMFVQMNVPGWKLVIIGGNAKNQDQLSDLKRLVAELGAEDRVELTGKISNVGDHYKKASVFAFTSSSEGFPNVVGEASAHGLPVVTYDCVAGPADIITNNVNGFLVKTHDHGTFKEKLGELMGNPSLRKAFAETAVEQIRKFSKEEIAEQYFNFITEKCEY
ncbi:glycosyltransferase [Flavobacterium sp.]|uniref:glycosyltransferase n=1 Tax=Flavobacterium sp. TaxID=239 RepID=UPI0040348965